MKLLITGGAGFIGSFFTKKAVKNGFGAIVVDSLTYAGDLERLKEVESNIKFYKASITNKEFLEHIFKQEKPDIVIHFAAETHVDRSILKPSIFIETNALGTNVLLELSKDFDIKLFINIITDEVYGELKETGQFYEDTPLNPSSPYSASKASQDMLGRAYFRTYGLPVITVRPSNNYGPWQYPEKLIPIVILKALKDEPIPVYGQGLNVREWLFVEDCVEAIFTLIEKGKIGQIYNIGSSEERRNIDVVKTILKLLNKPESLISFVKDRKGHDFRYSLNFDKIVKETGWKPKVCFEEGIKITVDWYLKNLEWAESKLKYLRDYWEKVYK